MSQMHQRLQQSIAEFPEGTPLTGTSAVSTVVRRGRRRLLATRVVGGTLAVMLTAGGAAALPHVLRPAPPTPEIAGEVPTSQEPVEKATAGDETSSEKAASKLTYDGEDEPAPEVTDHLPKHTEETSEEPEPVKTSEPVAAPKPQPEPKPEPEPTKEPEPVHVFTAEQAWNVSDDEPPMTVYEGTGVPGHGVWVYSEYGETFGEIREDGTFRIEATFPNAPYGTTTFPVKVKDKVTGERVIFELTTIRDGSVGEVAFSANQKYESKEYAPPYNYYFGTATPGTHIEVTSEYGSALGEANANGQYEIKVWFEGIPEGSSLTFPVTVTHQESGQQQVFEFTGHHPAPPEPTVAFTANQVYGECPDPLPYDVFYGTAEPNTVVRIWASYEGWDGWVETLANESGDWEVRVEFPGAPDNQPFEVKVVSDFTGEKLWFGFVATYSAS